LERLLKTHQLHKADATFIIQRVRQPEKYGVVEIGEGKGPPLTILRLTEKPEKPLTNLAIMPLYVFESTIFDALESTKPGKGGEIQLTDAMQHLIEQGRTIQATQLKHGEFSLDVGTAETYWEALRISYERAISRSR
ncbi:sugar phosphate nucleotidyltransferase, partial [Candidatus Bathyarchaeota archaeon]|nr:sugar phosphate nucleotidyltransferase [Candidatus Bathyarchaeota archaeon]